MGLCIGALFVTIGLFVHAIYLRIRCFKHEAACLEYSLYGKYFISFPLYEYELMEDGKTITYKRRGKGRALMNDKLNGWRMVLACMLLLFPSLVIGLLLIHLIEGVTGSTVFGYLVGFLVAGVGPAVPLIFSVQKSKRMKVAVKYMVIILAVFLFMGGIFMMTRTPNSQYEEFQRRQQEWENKK